MPMSEAQIDRDIADGRPQRSFYKPLFPRLFFHVLYNRQMHDRWSPRVQAFLWRHWPGSRTPWEY